MKLFTGRSIFLCITVFAFASTEPIQQDQINNRIQELRETLLSRKSPESLLLPSLDTQSRTEESHRVMRAYVSLQFSYNLADIRSEGENLAEIPVRIHWETPQVQGYLTGTMKLTRVGDKWYFRSFDFLLFPWNKVIAASLVAVAFTVGIFLVYRRLRRRKLALGS